jgi:hypothetical protein
MVAAASVTCWRLQGTTRRCHASLMLDVQHVVNTCQLRCKSRPVISLLHSVAVCRALAEVGFPVGAHSSVERIIAKSTKLDHHLHQRFQEMTMKNHASLKLEVPHKARRGQLRCKSRCVVFPLHCVAVWRALAEVGFYLDQHVLPRIHEKTQSFFESLMLEFRHVETRHAGGSRNSRA